MQLQVSGLNANASPFSSVWGRYVTGFNQTKHCQACLKGTAVDLTALADDKPVDLRPDAQFFYLCALGRPRSAESNVQLVVKPHPGSVATVGSLYGVVFTVKDAIAIRIRALPLGWQKLAKDYTQCPNFQFGVQTYGYSVTDNGLDFGRHVQFPPPESVEA